MKAHKILILRSDNIGDCVLFSGALKWFRQKWPEARIDLMVQSHVCNLFGLCPYIDRVLSTGRFFPWLILRKYVTRGTWFLERVMRQEWVKRLTPYPRYDLVVCPVSAPTEDCMDLVRHIHAAEKWGFGGLQLNIDKLTNEENRPERVFTSCYENRAEEQWEHELLRTRKFLTHFDIPSDSLWPDFWLPDEDKAYATNVMPSGKTVGIFIGAFHWWCRWPVPKWGKLLAGLGAEHVVIFGSARDDEQAAEILATDGGKSVAVTDLTGKTTLRQMAACIARCDLVVSTDSSGLHFATALRMPTVGLMGGYHYGRYYPWGDERINRVARIDLDCYYCNNKCIHDDYRCVQGIPVETVLKELEIAAGNSSGPGSRIVQNC